MFGVCVWHQSCEDLLLQGSLGAVEQILEKRTAKKLKMRHLDPRTHQDLLSAGQISSGHWRTTRSHRRNVPRSCCIFPSAPLGAPVLSKRTSPMHNQVLVPTASQGAHSQKRLTAACRKELLCGVLGFRLAGSSPLRTSCMPARTLPT